MNDRGKNKIKTTSVAVRQKFQFNLLYENFLSYSNFQFNVFSREVLVFDGYFLASDTKFMSTFTIINEAQGLFSGTDNNNVVQSSLVQPPNHRIVNKCRSRTQAAGRTKILNRTMSQRKFTFKAPSKPPPSKGPLYSSQRPVATPLNVVTNSTNYSAFNKDPPKNPPPKADDDDLWPDDDIG